MLHGCNRSDHDADLSDCIPGIDTGSIRTDAGGTGTSYRTSGGTIVGASIVAAGALRGAGDTFVPSLMNLGSIWIVRLGLAMILVKSLGLYGMWIAMAVELCVRG